MANAKSRISNELKYIIEDPMFYGGPQQLTWNCHSCYTSTGGQKNGNCFQGRVPLMPSLQRCWSLKTNKKFPLIQGVGIQRTPNTVPTTVEQVRSHTYLPLWLDQNWKSWVSWIQTVLSQKQEKMITRDLYLAIHDSKSSSFCSI
jgi:hypothetical protein